jgi:hypothetical protein
MKSQTMQSINWPGEDILRTFLLHGSTARCNNTEELIKFAFGDPLISEWFKVHRGVLSLEKLSDLPRFILDRSAISEVCSRRDALRLLLAHEIETDIDYRVSLVLTLMEEIPSLESAVDRAYGRSIRWYESVGLKLSGSFPVKVVEEYPHPYDSMTGAAMVPDETDAKRYGISPGIYFRKDKMCLVPSSLTVAHELVHAFVATTDEGLLSRGLEEGLGEFFAFVLVAPELFSVEVAENLFISKRLKYTGHKQRFQTYMDYFRVATWLYGEFGLNGLIDLLHKGRRTIKNVEMDLVSGRLPKAQLSRSAPNSKLLQRAERLALLFPEHEVVSPEAFYLVLRSQRGGTPLQSALHTSALTELQDRVFGVFMNSDGVVEFDDFPTLFATPSFRYSADVDSIDS